MKCSSYRGALVHVACVPHVDTVLISLCVVVLCIRRWKDGGQTPTRDDFTLQWDAPSTIRQLLSGMDVEDVERTLSLKDNGWLSGQCIDSFVCHALMRTNGKAADDRSAAAAIADVHPPLQCDTCFAH